ncbi:MAG TPA: GxxExxY protein [Planctomycetota bacterium]|nr:GxxExxY protein [Planctomycetota bacterium]
MPQDAPRLLHEELSGLVRQTAYEIHSYLGNGFLEKVYENALVNRLRKKGIDVKPQERLVVHDEDGTVLGEYFADVVVNDIAIVEIKAVSMLVSEHVSQILNYLKASRRELGLLVNFGTTRLQFKRYVFAPLGSVSSVSSVSSVAIPPPADDARDHA